jgi:hypothetical protein
MHGLTDYITECRWADVFLVWYVLIDDAYHARFGNVRLRQRGPTPTVSDAEVITLSVIADTYFHGNEELMLSFIGQYHRDLFPHLLEHSRFTRRRHALSDIIEALRRQLCADLIPPDDDLRLIDSAPVPLCTYQRSRRCATVQGRAYCSVMPSRKAKLFGVRVHLTTTLEQIPDQWFVAPAAPHDSKVAEILLSEATGLVVLGDNGFYDPLVQARLAQTRQIQLLAPPQPKQRQGQWSPAERRVSNRLRRRIETSLSVLTTVFQLERPGARSWAGLLTRLASRFLAYTLSFFTKAILQPKTSN